MLSKKDHEAIAQIIKQATDEHKANQPTRYVLEGIGLRLATYFEDNNSRFDRQRFLTACGLYWQSHCQQL